MDLTQAEDIKKKWQEYTEELYKKDLHDPDNHNGMIAHLGPDILECDIKWALGSITMNKASGLDGHEFEQRPGAGDGQGALLCCMPRSHKESDTT